MVQVEKGVLRFVRAGILGLCVGLVSVLGHLLGHGDLPLVAIAQVLGLALAAGGALTGRQLRWQLLLPFVAAFELSAHWLLGRMAPAHAGSPVAGHVASHHGLALHQVGTERLIDPAQLDLGGGFWPQLDAAAIGGHIIAGTVIVLLVSRADAAIFILATALVGVGQVLLGRPYWTKPTPVSHAPRVMPLELPTRGAQRLSALPVWLTRGPPAGVVTA